MDRHCKFHNYRFRELLFPPVNPMREWSVTFFSKKIVIGQERSSLKIKGHDRLQIWFKLKFRMG